MNKLRELISTRREARKSGEKGTVKLVNKNIKKEIRAMARTRNNNSDCQHFANKSRTNGHCRYSKMQEEELHCKHEERGRADRVRQQKAFDTIDHAVLR